MPRPSLDCSSSDARPARPGPGRMASTPLPASVETPWSGSGAPPRGPRTPRSRRPRSGRGAARSAARSCRSRSGGRFSWTRPGARRPWHRPAGWSPKEARRGLGPRVLGGGDGRRGDGAGRGQGAPPAFPASVNAATFGSYAERVRATVIRTTLGFSPRDRSRSANTLSGPLRRATDRRPDKQPGASWHARRGCIEPS